MLNNLKSGIQNEEELWVFLSLSTWSQDRDIVEDPPSSAKANAYLKECVLWHFTAQTQFVLMLQQTAAGKEFFFFRVFKGKKE